MSLTLSGGPGRVRISGGGSGNATPPQIFDGIVAPPSVSTLTWFNQGNATASDGQGILNVSIPSGQPGNARRILGVAIPATPYTLDIGFTWSSSTTVYPVFGMGAYEQSTGKVLEWDLYWNGSVFETQFSRLVWNAPSGQPYSDTAASSRMSAITCFLRMVDDGTNISVYWSNDNVNWTQFDTARSRTDYMASGPSHIGLCFDAVVNSGASFTARVFHWKMH